MNGIIQFDRIENNRLYLGFTEEEVDVILTLLERHRPDEEITNRIDVLTMVFRNKKRKEVKE